jgi:hypothetical protein
MSGPPIITSATGKYRTTCRLCGKAVAESGPLEMPIIGNPGDKAAALTTILYRHLSRHHKDELIQGSALASEVPPFFILAAFQSEDPTLTARVEQVRAAIFALVRKNSMQDSMIEHIVATIGLDPDDAKKVAEAMRALRDACCEMGTFAPSTPPPVKSLLFTT